MTADLFGGPPSGAGPGAARRVVRGTPCGDASDGAGRQPPPHAPLMPPPLRSRLWVAVGGEPERDGIYSRWENGAAAAREGSPPCVVIGYPSLSEVKEFLRGAGLDVPDRRY